MSLKKAQLEVASLKSPFTERQSGLLCSVFLFGNMKTLHVYTSFSFHLSFKWLPLKRKAERLQSVILTFLKCVLLPSQGGFVLSCQLLDFLLPF